MLQYDMSDVHWSTSVQIQKLRFDEQNDGVRSILQIFKAMKNITVRVMLKNKVVR